MRLTLPSQSTCLAVRLSVTLAVAASMTASTPSKAGGKVALSHKSPTTNSAPHSLRNVALFGLRTKQRTS